KIGTMLNVKPVLNVDDEGKLKLYQNVRGRKKSIKYLAGRLDAFVKENPDMLVIIGHGDCPSEAQNLQKLVEEKVDPSRVIVSNLAHTIATHVGPDMLALA
ncbi:DegV like protein, partial [Aduncisulcus paluster]